MATQATEMGVTIERAARRARAGKQKGHVDACPSSRVEATLSMAAATGLTTGKKQKRLSGRTHEELLAAATSRSGLEGSDLLEYALAKVALEDDFGERLLARRGTIPGDLDLGI